MKYIKKHWVRIVAAAMIGFLLAYAGVGITHATRQCTPAEVPKGEPIYTLPHCFVYQKVFMSPSDLINNKQNSLIRFSETFAMGSLVSLGILSLINIGKRASLKTNKGRTSTGDIL